MTHMTRVNVTQKKIEKRTFQLGGRRGSRRLHGCRLVDRTHKSVVQSIERGQGRGGKSVEEGSEGVEYEPGSDKRG